MFTSGVPLGQTTAVNVLVNTSTDVGYDLGIKTSATLIIRYMDGGTEVGRSSESGFFNISTGISRVPLAAGSAGTHVIPAGYVAVTPGSATPQANFVWNSTGLTKTVDYPVKRVGYVVTFDKNGGLTEAGPRQMVVQAPDTTVGTLPTPPTLPGYTFDGWNTRADGRGTAFTASTTVTADITVYAQWIGPYYTLRFNANGGNGIPDAQSLMAGQLARTPNRQPTYDGHTFVSWNTRADGTGTTWDFAANRMPAHDVTLYAQWNPGGNPTVPDQSENGPTPIVREEGETVLPGPDDATETTPQQEAPAGSQSILQDIINGRVPLGGLNENGGWSLLSLLVALLGLAITVVLTIGILFIKGDKDNSAYEEAEEYDPDQEKPKPRRRILLHILALISGLVPGILFLILENLRMPMVWITRWTPWIVLAFMVHAALLVLFIFIKRRKKDDQDEELNMPINP